MSSFFDSLYTVGVIPVIEIDSADHAGPLAESLLAGGLPIIEITLRTEAGLESIRRIASRVPGSIVGAGTVINRGQAEAAQNAGAKFIVCPGMIEEVVLWANANQLPILAGAVTPTEMIRGIQLKMNLLKFFPSEAMGGVKAIKAISDPFPQLRFVPSGGIRLENAAEYLQENKILAVGGSWMAKRAMIAEERFDEIRVKAEEASKLVRETRTLNTES
jgi:2-dehydro-3-deoxyphosphogluconate aldolase / (4S)-4-hydroxy-2-oxoglutarate aldolase